MGNWLSGISFERSSANSHIDGSYSGNSGSNNTSIIFNNHGSTTWSETCAEILQCLYTSVYSEHRGRVRKPVEGTCTWVIDHPKYKEWLENKTSGLLWLSADPGCGKSVTASFLITHLERERNTTVCYFFFKDDSEEQRSAKYALCAILHQLFSKQNSLCKYAETAFRSKGKRFVEEVDELWNILVKAVAEGGCGDVICVVDALDECEKKSLDSLIDHVTRIRGLQTSGTPLKFLVTSRPYQNIEMALGSPTTTIRVMGEEEVDAISADVTRVIDDGIEKLETYWGEAGPLEDLRKFLRSSADRTFLWVSLVLKRLEESEGNSPEEFTDIVTNTPTDLAGLYTKILNKSTNPEKARQILQIVVAAARPLKLQEMSIALKIKQDQKAAKDLGGLPSGFEKSVKNKCGLFVRIIDSKIYFVHQTAREFLIKGALRGEGNWQYTICPRDSGFVLADICVSYLLMEDFENDPFAMSLEGKTAEYAAYQGKYALLDYASQHWARHFRDSQDRQMELFEHTRQICRVGSNRFLTWLGVYWRNGAVCDPPEDFTHLMIASWLGQQTIVERLLEEGRDINARSEVFGTALNIAAVKRCEEIAKTLVEGNVVAYVGGKEFNILHTKRSELEKAIEFREEQEELEIEMALEHRRQNNICKGCDIILEIILESRESVERIVSSETEDFKAKIMEFAAVEFLKPFCIPDTPDQHTLLAPSKIPLP